MSDKSEELRQSENAAKQAERRAALQEMVNSAYVAYQRIGKVSVSVFEDLLLELYRPTCSFLRNTFGIIRDDQQKEIFQTVAYLFLRHADQYKEQYPFLPWWYAIVRNAAVNFCVANTPYSSDYKPLENCATFGVREFAEQSERSLLVNTALGKLDRSERELLWQHYVEGFTAQELSKLREEPLHTTKYYIRRALKNLRMALQFEPLPPVHPTTHPEKPESAQNV